MCNCYTFENPGPQAGCPAHAPQPKQADWFQSTGYGSDYNIYRVTIVKQISAISTQVRDSAGRLHTVRTVNLRMKEGN